MSGLLVRYLMVSTGLGAGDVVSLLQATKPNSSKINRVEFNFIDQGLLIVINRLLAI
jgi:hypothetical protein